MVEFKTKYVKSQIYSSIKEIPKTQFYFKILKFQIITIKFLTPILK